MSKIARQWFDYYWSDICEWSLLWTQRGDLERAARYLDALEELLRLVKEASNGI